MKTTRLGLVLSFFPLTLAFAMWAPLTVQEACDRSRLVLVGTLEKPASSTVKADGFEWEEFRGRIAVAEVLYGRLQGQPVDLSWGDGPQACGLDHGDLVGRPRIWCLIGGTDGVWKAWHPDCALDPASRPDVVKALHARLEAYRRTIEAEKDLAALIAGPPGGKERALPAAWAAFIALGDAGPAAVPVARALLAHAQPVQRAWGCRLAAVLGEKALAGDLAALLEDKAEVDNPIGGCLVERRSVGALARKALDGLGKP